MVDHAGRSAANSLQRIGGALARAGRALFLASLPLLAGCAGGGPEGAEPGEAREVELQLSTSSMSVARVKHSATRLLDGRVLVSGGEVLDSSGIYVVSAEIYDPATEGWTPAAPPSIARSRQTATLLPDGRVLALGGAWSSWSPNYRAGRLASGEAYHPGANVWAAIAPMARARAEHTATLLADGRVLVTGGYSEVNEAPTATCEIYDPTTGAWSPARSMGLPRKRHAAVLLQDGRVLVAGGAGDHAELYDPATDTWSSTGPMASRRDLPLAATLLPSGKVFAISDTPRITTPPLDETPMTASSEESTIAASRRIVRSTRLRSLMSRMALETSVPRSVVSGLAAGAVDGRILAAELNEAIEHPRAHLGGDARPRVRHADLHRGAVLHGAHGHRGPGRGMVDGVLDEVLERAAQQVRVGLDGGHLDGLAQRERPGARAQVERGERLEDERAEIDARALGGEPPFLALADVEQVVDEPQQGARLIADVPHGVARLLGERAVAEQELRVQVHAAHGVLQIVHDEGRELLLLELEAHERVPLLPDELDVLAQLRAEPAQP